MKSVSFDQATNVLPPPAGRQDLLPLQVNVHQGTVSSCWRMSWRERLSALFFGTVWVRVMDPGGVQPPMALDARKTIF